MDINLSTNDRTNITNADTKVLNDDTTELITADTTLGELIAMLHLGEKPADVPTPKKLRETVGEPVVSSPDPLGYGTGCQVYVNGYAVYDNGSGRTVIWLPDCISFTYFFVQPKETEVGICPPKDTLPEGLLESQPWAIPVTLIGEHRIDANLMNRMGSRTGTTDFSSQDDGDKDGDAEAKLEDFYRKEFTWREGRFGEDPLECFLRKDRQREMLEAFTQKQREVFTLYYRDGYTQAEIADILDVSQPAIKHRLDGALLKIKKLF